MVFSWIVLFGDGMNASRKKREKYAGCLYTDIANLEGRLFTVVRELGVAEAEVEGLEENMSEEFTVEVEVVNLVFVR